MPAYLTNNERKQEEKEQEVDRTKLTQHLPPSSHPNKKKKTGR